MVRDELISEISMRRDIPMDMVEEVLDEEDVIFLEEEKACKKKRCIILSVIMIILVAASVACVCIGNKKDVDIEESVKNYVEKYRR